MATTLQIPSFSESNIRERAALGAASVAGATTLMVETTQGIEAGSQIYVGPLSREGCEPAIVQAVVGSSSITLTAPLVNDHAAFEPITSVTGQRIRIYRALNVDGTVPPEGQFSITATRSIDPDQETTYYTDSSGSSAYWYRFTYFNEATSDETALSASDPVRGDDFGHYASISEIRREAGFTNAVNLSDVDVDQQRRAAESEINSSLGGFLTVPFIKPIPAIVQTITIQLAAGLLLQQFYGRDSRGKALVDAARALIQSMQTGDSSTGDDNVVASGVAGYPDDDGPRMFSVEDRY